jgi:hypothetical protein
MNGCIIPVDLLSTDPLSIEMVATVCRDRSDVGVSTDDLVLVTLSHQFSLENIRLTGSSFEFDDYRVTNPAMFSKSIITTTP